MNSFTGTTILLAALATAGCGTGRLDFQRCAQGVFGETRCEFTETVDDRGTPQPRPERQHVFMLGAGALTCVGYKAETAGTRIYRRCKRMAYQVAQRTRSERH